MTHLTQEERYRIWAWKQNKISQKKIAEKLNRHPSTISLELRRNADKKGDYVPAVAQRKADERRRATSSQCRVCPQIKAEILEKVACCGWSPEQAVGRMELEKKVAPAVQTIYHWIAKEVPGKVGYVIKRYRQRGKQEKRGRINDRTPISARPQIANRRGRRGDFEADTMLGRLGGSAIVVCSDRLTRYVSLRLVSNRTAKKTNAALVNILSHSVVPPWTITVDNGKEFAEHKALSAKTGCRCYFTDTYAAWQKGTVENTIGVLRRWLGKGADFSRLTPQYVKSIEQWFNYRPMKCLGYRTPHEVYNLSTLIAFQIGIRR